MKPEELLKACEERLKEQGENAQIMLCLPWEPTTDRVRLGKTVGPFGTAVSVGQFGTNAIFSCRKIYKALKKELG